MGLKKKIGPLPAWAWGVIVLAVAAYFLYFRKSSAGTNAGTVVVPQQAPPQQTPLDQNAGAINGAQAGQPSTAAAPADQLSSDVLQTLGAENSSLVTALSSALGNAYQAGVGPYATSTGYGIAPAAPDTTLPPATVSTPTATSSNGSAGGRAPAAQPFGGVVSKTKTKTGATITTYANGRRVEQAKGKPAYVIAKGR